VSGITDAVSGITDAVSGITDAEADARLKGFLETAADCLHTIAHSPTALEDLRGIGGQKSPPVPVILVLEAVIVLLSPTHSFSGPNPAVFGASWQASHRLLLLPPAELARRLRCVGPVVVSCCSVLFCSVLLCSVRFGSAARVPGSLHYTLLLCTVSQS
jgi:hypothetical protein